jgi:hypothetical protein
MSRVKRLLFFGANSAFVVLGVSTVILAYTIYFGNVFLGIQGDLVPRTPLLGKFVVVSISL